MTSKKIITSTPTPAFDIPHITKEKKEMAKDKLKELIQEETRMVRGTFKHYESPGASVKITVRKYPGIPHFEKTMTDDCIYEIPLYVARHLNGIDASAGAATNDVHTNPNIGTCSYIVHGFKYSGGSSIPPPSMDGNGPGGESGIPVPIVGIAKRVKRFGFHSNEYASEF